MNTLWLVLEGGWHILLAGLIAGAGLPAIFALGIRALSWGAAGADTVEEHRPHVWGKIAAGICFAIVLFAVAFGIAIIVAHGFGMTVVFGWPVFVPR